jgi:long-chain acyl-CoA synthetase
VHKSLAATFFARSNSLKQSPAVRYKEGRSAYTDMSWSDFGTLTGEMAFGLAALGLEPHKCAAIFANNSHLWVAADYATISNGAASVPIYPTSSQHDIEFILANSEAEFAFVQNDKLLKKILSAHQQLPTLKKIVLFNLPEDKTLVQLGLSLGLSEEEAGTLLLDIDGLRQLGRTFITEEPKIIDQRIASTDPFDAVTIIYTSGTTGVPKGVKLTHANILSVLDDLPEVFPLADGDVYLSYLPMSHVFERICGEFYWTQSGGVIAFAESIELMAKNLAEVQPTMILVVPRVLDRIYAKVKSGMEGASGRARKLIDWSIYVGKEVIRTKAAGRQPSPGLRAKLWLAEKLVFKKLRQRIGPRLKLVISGGAPATPHVIEFFNAVGIQTLEGYGLTETSAPASVNRRNFVKIGSVGPSLSSVKVRIAEDGEILLKGGSIFSGYHKNEEATKEAFESGWFKTGDIGHLDKDGHLRITDRKKDLIINAAGKNIAPQRIEAVLKTIPHVTQAVVFGDKQKHLVALVTLDEHAVQEFAREKNWQFESYQELVELPELTQFIRKEIHLRSGQLADYEQVRKFEILPQDLSVEEGELTATLKIKRNVIAKRYAGIILRLYQEKESAAEKDSGNSKSNSVKDSLAERSR